MLERLEVDLTKIRIFPVLKPDFLPAMQILHFGTTRFGLSITWEFQNRKACPRDIQNANLALASLWGVKLNNISTCVSTNLKERKLTNSVSFFLDALDVKKWLVLLKHGLLDFMEHYALCSLLHESSNCVHNGRRTVV